MINFVVCDDDRRYRNEISSILTRYMMNYDVDYNTHVFEDYNDAFIKMTKKKLSNKIYILDIETPTRSGIDVARIIRKYDMNSVIIFLTGHQELGFNVLENVALFLRFISKFDDWQKKLVTTLDDALKVLNYRKNIRFKDNGVIYTIALDDIISVIRDTVDRKLILKTEYNTFKLNMSLKDFKELIDDNFVQTHRACIVNKRRIVSSNKSKRLIVMDNGDVINLVSVRFDWTVI